MEFKILQKDSEEFRQMKILSIKEGNKDVMKQIKQISKHSTKGVAVVHSFYDLLKLTSIQSLNEVDLIISNSDLAKQLSEIIDQDKAST